MSGFSRDWLALRAGADDRARSAELIAMAADMLSARRPTPDSPVRIVDLGAGTGATMRALAPHLPHPQGWTLLDADPALLHVAEREAAARAEPGVAVAVQRANLRDEPAPWDHPPDLVTASALFDLASPDFISALADRLAADRVPLLAMLTYDGRLRVEPAHPHDEAMVNAFNIHQKGHKSFGPAVGPDGPLILRGAMEERGFSVHTRDSAWVLERPRDEALMRAKLEGWAAAAGDVRPDDDAIDEWLAHHDANAIRIVVGHRDLLAVPA